MKITITNQQNFVPIDEAKIKNALKNFEFLSFPSLFRLSLVYVDDATIADLNERYLKHEGPTDVLSFPLTSHDGEIIASGETALREATERGIEPEGEIFLYTVHGVLHLLGYDDKTKEEALEMRKLEKESLTRMGYSWNWDEESEC